MLQCVKCKTEVENSLLCDKCMETDNMAKDGMGGSLGGPTESMAYKINIKDMEPPFYGDEIEVNEPLPNQSQKVIDHKYNKMSSTEEILEIHDQLKAEQVNHPKHYNYGKYEAIDVIEDWELGFHLGNVVKYISRAGKKDKNTELQDLKKALWYMQRRIENLENNDE